MFYGGWVAVLPAVVMDYFGGRNVSGIIGILYTSVAFGTLIGPSAAGFAFDLEPQLHAADPGQRRRQHHRRHHRRRQLGPGDLRARETRIRAAVVAGRDATSG